MDKSLAIKKNKNSATLTFSYSVIEKIARILALIGILFLSISPTLNGLLFVAALLTLFSGNIREKWKMIIQNKMYYFVFLLTGLFFLGALYNTHGFIIGLKGFYKYLIHFTIMTLLLPLFIDAKWRRWAINLLIASTLLISVVLYWPFIGINVNHTIASIEFSVLLAFTTYLLLHKLCEQKIQIYRMIDAALILYFFYAVYFLNYERTGMLVLLILLCLFTWQRLQWQGLLLGLLTVTALVTILWSTSSTFHSRVSKGIHELMNYSHSYKSSLGLRIYFAQQSLHLIKQHPIGLGTGLFTKGSDSIHHHRKNIGTTLNNYRLNPENTYFHIALQIGWLGLLVFIGLLIMQYYETRYLPPSEKYLTQGLIITLIVSSFFIIAFYLNRTAVFYSTFSAIFFAARFNTNKKLLTHYMHQYPIDNKQK